MSLGSTVSLAVERIVEPVEAMHRAIAKPWFTALGALGKPVHRAQDAISRLVYESIRIGATAAGIGLDAWKSDDSSSAGAAQAVVNGLWGDTLGRYERRLGTPMSIRNRDGAALSAGPHVAAGFPNATGQLVVLVHGLVVTERCWRDTEAAAGLLSSIEKHPHLTPVPIRYNTGLPVATNGALLAELLEQIHADWPQPVDSIALVGHSMGGLVIRSACAQAHRARHRWLEDVNDIITIGSPHKGAPLEKLVSLVARGLNAAPQTRPLADFLNGRSQGIKDLRSGRIDSAADTDPEFESVQSGIRHHFVAGVITPNPAHPVGAAFGDLMVPPASSTTVSSPEPTNVVVLGGVNHFNLPHDPAVIERVMGWLAPSQ